MAEIRRRNRRWAFMRNSLAAPRLPRRVLSTEGLGHTGSARRSCMENSNRPFIPFFARPRLTCADWATSAGSSGLANSASSHCCNCGSSVCLPISLLIRCSSRFDQCVRQPWPPRSRRAAPHGCVLQLRGRPAGSPFAGFAAVPRWPGCVARPDTPGTPSSPATPAPRNWSRRNGFAYRHRRPVPHPRRRPPPPPQHAAEQTTQSAQPARHRRTATTGRRTATQQTAQQSTQTTETAPADADACCPAEAWPRSSCSSKSLVFMTSSSSVGSDCVWQR